MDDAAIDGSHVRALKGAHTGPSPVDRARPGSKHHLIVDRHGTPLAVSLTSGNRHNVTQLMPLLDAIPRIRGVRGRPRHRPGRLPHGTGRRQTTYVSDCPVGALTWTNGWDSKIRQCPTCPT